MLKFVCKKINNLLNWLYSYDGYFSLKSGLYIDHYFKTFFHRVTKELNLFFGLIFMDAFILNRLSFLFFSNISKLSSKLKNFKNKYNFLGFKQAVFVFLMFLFIFIYFIFIFYF